MKLGIWFAIANADGSKRRKFKLAQAIGRSQATITAYCDGRARPTDETLLLIEQFTGGDVTKADFFPEKRRRRAA